jgi:peptide/nickel transport system substrate-binding protein
MRRSIVLSIGLLIPLVLFVLLFSSVLSLAAPSVGESSAGSSYGAGVELSAAPLSQPFSLAPQGAASPALDADILWGWESAPRDQEDEGFPTWLTNLPPRPRPDTPPPPVKEQPLGEQLSFPALQWTAQAARKGPAPSPAPQVGLPAFYPLPAPATIEAPLAPAASYTLTLQTVHRGSDSEALSSTFVFTNTGALPDSFTLDFYWPNDQYVGSDALGLNAGEAAVYDMDAAPFGEQTFVGYVEISSDQPIEGQILTPDYGLISGVVYGPDGSTPLQINGASVNRSSDDAWFGGVYGMSDGRFYLGGLPDGDFVIWAHASYPWANQWYDGKTSRDQADAVTISGANEAAIAVTMQPGGRITGTVYAGDGVTPLEYVNVDIEQGNFGICTDANGNYVIEGLPYGDYKVVAGRGWNWCLGTQSTWAPEYYQETTDPDAAAVLTVSAGDDTVEGIDFTLDEGGVIEGTVFAEDGVTPLENVNVDIEQGGYGTCTGASGQYTLVGLPYGDLKVQAGGDWNWCLAQESQYLVEYYQEKADAGSADVLSIGPGSLSYAGIDFTLSTGGSILGRVTDASSGAGLAGVWVSANNYDDGSWGRGAWTDAGGYYAITGLLDQDYRVSVEGDSVPTGYAQQYYPDEFAHHLAGRVTVSGGETVTDIDFHLVPGGTISGVVRDAGTGLPIPNLNVDAWLENDGGGIGACTDATGHFTIVGAIYAEYGVEASTSWNWCLSQPAEYARTYYDHVYDRDQLTLVAVNELSTDVTGIDFDLEPGGAVTGRVTDDVGNPLENVNVGSNVPGTGIGEGACSGPDGYYEIYALPYDEYVVQAASDWNWCLGEPSPYLTEYWEEVHTYDEATPVPVSGTPQVGIDFTMEEGGSITGRVTAASDGSPLADVWVYANNYDDGSGGRGARTDADGYYTIAGLLDQDYRVAVDGSNVPYGYAQQFYPDQFAHHLAGRVTISGGGTVADIDFHLVPGGIITGVITDMATGLPLADINVSSGLIDGEGGVGNCTGADGSFTLYGAVYGDYAVSAGGGWDYCRNQPSEFVQKYWDGVYLREDATPVTVDDPAPVMGINLEMEPGGYIAGNVSDTGGSPVEGLTVSAVLPGDCPWCHQWLASTETGANGDYLLGPLPPFEVAVYACASCSGQLYVDEWYDNVWNVQDAMLLPITVGVTVPGIDIVLDPGVLVTGTVTVPPGYSAEGLQVDVWEESNDGYGAGGQTDADGFYQVPVPPIYDSHWSVAVHPWGADLGSQWAHDFDLSRHTTWDFDLGPGATIAGAITSGGVPVQDANVYANSPWMGDGAQTDAAGNYEITNLPPGEYEVNAGRWPDYMDTYYGGHNWEWDTPIGLEEGETQDGVDVDITPLGRLYGTVTESDGTTPIEGVHVTAMNEDGYWDAWTQPDGAFYLDVPAGGHRVFFWLEDGWTWIPMFYGGSYTYRDADVVVVAPYFPAEIPTTLNVNLAEPATLDGTVRDANTGDPVAGVMVAVENRDPAVDRRAALWSDCTDESGQYHIDHIWPGQNQVWAVGTCGGNDYGIITDTLVAMPGGNHVLDLEVTAGTAPPRPFTIRTANSSDYTPLSSMGVTSVTDADEILPALFTPLVEMNDQNDWVSELLVQVPTLDNGGAVIAGDRLVVTYELLPGLLWSDGVPLTSDDIRFTWEFMTRPSMEADTYVAYVNPLWQIERIDTPDLQTAVVTYRPEYLPPGFEGAIGYLMPEHVLAGEVRFDVRWNSDYAHYPVGNGPYVVVDYMPGSHIDLRANPNYHRRGEGLPAIEEVRFLFTNHPDYALPSGQADVALNVDPGVYAGFDIPTRTRIKSAYTSVVPNTDLPFFEDVRVRQALYYALDRDQFIAGYTAYDVKADAYLPPGHPMFTDTLVRYPFDLGAAAGLLNAAGWTDHNANGIRDKDGVEFEFDLAYRDTSVERQGLCLIWQEDLATLGVDANCVPMEWSELYQAGRRGELDAYAVGWIFDSRYDPMGYGLFHSRSVPSAYNSYWGGNPMNHWADPDPTKTDAWLEAARTELDPDVLRGYYADHLTRFTDQVPSWMYSHTTRTDAYVPILHNFAPGQATPATWNIEEWALEPNPYDLAVRKMLAVDSPAPQPGAAIIYEIQVHNYGTQPLTNVRLLDTLPTDVLFVSATPPEASQSGNVLTWNLGDLAANTSTTPVRVTVQIPAEVVHGTVLANAVEVYGDQADTWPTNNGFVYTVEVRDDVDVAVTKAGVGQAAIGAEYTYLIDYANWGGAPADGVVITDTLPAEVTFVGAVPAPTEIDGLELTWALPMLLGNQWAGQILVTTEIAASGTAENTAEISFLGTDVDLTNNTDLASEEIDEILAPIIIQPTQGTTGDNPLFRGLAPSGSTVELWDLSAGATSLGSTVAASDGTWELPLTLEERGYAIAAKATKAALTSGYSNSATIVVKYDLPLDTNSVSITTSDVDIARGVVEADRRTLGYRTLVIEAEIPCGETPDPRLRVIENGLWQYIIPPVSMTEVEAGLWEVTFHLWMSDPHSTYDIWLDWECGLESQSVRLLSVVIDPDGYVYDGTLVSAGAAIADSLVIDAQVTAYVWRPDLEDWQVWPAGSYGQFNPQWTDGVTPDGVLVEGYYSFLTPPGQYRIMVEAPGYQPYQSPVLTVISEPIHHDIALLPIVGGSGEVVAPANLGGSAKQVDKDSARKGDTLTYDIWLANSGEWDTGSLSLTDAVPANTAYIDGSLSWSGGGSAEYNSTADAVIWSGVVPAGSQVHVSFQVKVTSDEGAPFDIQNVAQVEGPAENLSSLPNLAATTTVEPRGYMVYLPVVLRNY